MPVDPNMTTDDLQPPSNSMRAADFPDTWKAILTIADVDVKQFKDRDNPDRIRRKIILSWVGKEKVYVCNKTNQEFLVAALGKRLATWTGAKVKMARGFASYNGGQVASFKIVGAEPAPDMAGGENFDTSEVPF